MWRKLHHYHHPLSHTNAVQRRPSYDTPFVVLLLPNCAQHVGVPTLIIVFLVVAGLANHKMMHGLHCGSPMWVNRWCRRSQVKVQC